MITRAASRVILIRPTGFGHDPETAITNAFQRNLVDADVRMRAEQEFDALLFALSECGVGTTVLDPVDRTAPNGVFPNNWFSTHEDGTLVLYPMCTPSRRRERDPHLAEVLAREHFKVERVVDLSRMEAEGRFLEGTGSLVLDRERDLAFAALSPRTTERALNNWCGQMHYHQVPFLATMDGTITGQPLYHTNVLMSIGEDFVVVCLDALPYPVDREDVWNELDRGSRRIVMITLEQMHQFVGNMLQLRSPKGPFIFLSETAFKALQPSQRQVLEGRAQLVPVAIPTIEAVGGGSVRCMLAENFLPALG
jgi:hypothetical protein